MAKENVILRAQTLLNVESEKLEQLKIIVDMQWEALQAKIIGSSVPKELEYIVVETSIARYNRLGSEGLTSEGIDVITQSFTEDLFEPYINDILRYNSKASSPSKKLKLI